VSNGRKPSGGNQYRTGYLSSPAWHQRRRAWFAEEERRHGIVRCAVCSRRGTLKTLELHHVDYRGVRQTAEGRWIAEEPHEDLVAVDPRCHTWLHQLIDRDPVLRGLVGRRQANLQAISRLRSKITQQLKEWITK